MISREEYLKKVRQSSFYQNASLIERKRILEDANKQYDRRLEREKEEKTLKEEVYDSINNLEITDVFQNFEDKYGKDNTTELTTFKDLHQKDAFPPHGKDRANLFKAVHERDKNIGVEHQVFKNANKQKRMCEEMTYEDLFLEGYYDALNETKKEKEEEENFFKKHKKKIIAGAIGAGAIAGAAGAIHHDNKKSLAVANKAITNAKKEGTIGVGYYDTARHKSHLINDDSSRKEKIKVGRFMRAKDYIERKKYERTPKDQFRQSYIDEMEKRAHNKELNDKIMNRLGVKHEDYDELDEIFMEGYYDAINEMTEIDNYGDEYDYDEYNEYDELSDIDEDDIKHSYN